MQQVRSRPTQPLLSQQIPRKVCHSALVDCSKRQCFLFYQHYHTGGSGSFLSSSEIQDGAIVNQETLKYTLEDIESLRENFVIMLCYSKTKAGRSDLPLMLHVDI